LHPDVENYSLDISTLRTLFCFGNLTSVVIRSPLGFDLDDGAVLELARAWPRLESLHLKSHVEQPRNPTLGCLQSFAEHCPSLRLLGITLDARQVPAPDHSSATRIIQRSLAILNVDSSPIAAPISVGRYLSGLFPCLRTVRANNDEEYDSEVWLEVESMLPELNAIRQDE
ncbi:hypothetical protein C8R44DRAFT_549147, partial [Mycena epipterygia]